MSGYRLGRVISTFLLAMALGNLAFALMRRLFLPEGKHEQAQKAWRWGCIGVYFVLLLVF